MEKSININSIIKKLFNTASIKKKLSNYDIEKILKRSQLFSSSDFAETFLGSDKERIYNE